MVIGALVQPNSAANYRVAYPLMLLEQMGHEVRWPDGSGMLSLEALRTCDVVLVYRRADAPMQKAIAQLQGDGVAVVWDNDDDFLNMRQRRGNARASGMSTRQIFTEMVRTARLADAVILTGEPLADVFRGAGVTDDVHVIENYLWLEPRPARRAHEGVVVGWIAGVEHWTDAVGVQLSATLRKLMDKHPQLRVETVGVELKLTQRYTRTPRLGFDQLPAAMAGYDIGLAPILDTAFNRSRSNIKVKEYAAAGIPWLASPHGPYAGLGEEHGGRLVPDDGWFEALDDLITDAAARARLASAGLAWAQTQGVAEVIRRYEAILQGAVARVRGTTAVIAAPPVAAQRFTVKLPRG
jgi:glycosyltransferase involved in cell wall biosynthesis